MPTGTQAPTVTLDKPTGKYLPGEKIILTVAHDALRDQTGTLTVVVDPGEPGGDTSAPATVPYTVEGRNAQITDTLGHTFAKTAEPAPDTHVYTSTGGA